MLELGLLKQEETITLLCDNHSIKLVNNQSFTQNQSTWKFSTTLLERK
jgi:hypothetical protein